jgi:hypothetical protein
MKVRSFQSNFVPKNKPAKSVTLFCLIVFIAILTLSACTLIGYGIGSAIDSGNKKDKTIAGWPMHTIEPGEYIKVLLKNSDTLGGIYKGIIPLPESEYISIYETQKKYIPANVFIPTPGDTILIRYLNPNASLGIPSKEFKYLFAGIDLNSILVRITTSPVTGHIPFRMIDKVSDLKGNEITAIILKELVMANQIPPNTSIHLDQNGSIIKLFPWDIQQVTVKRKPNTASTIGLIVGMGADLVVAASLIANSIEEPPPPPPPSSFKFSCPYVYSFDGNKYIIDSETFGGAIFKAAQRTDLDNLDYLKESKGKYKLKLTNELEETQYIDEFKLIVTDHPAGTKVIPDFNGKLYSLNNLISPLKASDHDGNDILQLVKKYDRTTWISNPFTRNPEKKNDGRDCIYLEFEKPANADRVKLLFNLQNTDWAAYMQGHLLSLHGNKLDDWYALLNNSKQARENLKEIMIREGMLLIQLWNGSSWQTIDYVWEVGPSVAKEQVVELNLKNYTEHSLRIRLESTVGFWMIDCVEADYSEDVPITITELTATHANDHLGNDLLNLLKNTDENYYAQPTKQDWAVIEFDAIPKKTNTSRSFILKCNGYYTIHANAIGEPQKELLKKLITEPGAYGQYTLQVLHNNLVQSFQNNSNL